MRCAAKITPPCEEPVRAKGLCKGHYTRLWRGAEVDVPIRRRHRYAGAQQRKSVGVWLEQKAWSALRARAADRGTSPSALTAEVLRDWLKKTLEGS